MNTIKYYLYRYNDDYIIEESNTKSYKKGCYFQTIEELFVYLYDNQEQLSFFDIFNILKSNKIDYNKCDLIKYYISNCEELKDDDEQVYIKIKINKGFMYEILSITSKNAQVKKNIKGASLTLKITKQYIPFYLSVFIKEYTLEDYYPTLKSIYGDSRAIPFVDLYNHKKEYFIIRNRNKVVYISTNKENADYYINKLSSIRKDSSSYFVPNIEIITGFKNLVNYLKLSNPTININNMKNIVDFTGQYTCSSQNETNIHNIIKIPDTSYIIKSKENDYIFRETIDATFDFIVENKIYSPEVIELSDMKRVISRREIFKSIFLANASCEKEELYILDGVSILKDDNLIKISTNLVNILFLERTSYPCILIITDIENSMNDILFFFDERSMNKYLDSKSDNIVVLSNHKLSLKSISDKFIEKNLEILMHDYENYSPLDIAINLNSLYKIEDDTSNVNNINKIKKMNEIDCIIDVDSSLNGEVASCGIVFRDSSNKILCKISREVKAKTSVEAEIRGAMYAIKYAIMENYKEICIRYDYVGIFEYLITEPTNEMMKEYQQFFKNILMSNDIDIYFKKVKAHSKDEYNELADFLAGSLKY